MKAGFDLILSEQLFIQSFRDMMHWTAVSVLPLKLITLPFTPPRSPILKFFDVNNVKETNGTIVTPSFSSLLLSKLQAANGQTVFF